MSADDRCEIHGRPLATCRAMSTLPCQDDDYRSALRACIEDALHDYGDPIVDAGDVLSVLDHAGLRAVTEADFDAMVVAYTLGQLR